MSIYGHLTVILSLCWVQLNGKTILLNYYNNYYTIVLLLAIPGITLTSSPPPSSNGYFCPGPVQFTCVGTEIPSLTWRINNTYRGTYFILRGDTFPQHLAFSPPLSGVLVTITSASFSGGGQNIESTLTASVSDLNEILIECFSFVNINVQYESNTTVQERQGNIYCIS